MMSDVTINGEQSEILETDLFCDESHSIQYAASLW